MDGHGPTRSDDSRVPGSWRTAAMRTCIVAMVLLLGWSFACVAAVAAEPVPNDATLGQKPPEGAVVLIDGGSLDGWLKADGKAAAAWPVSAGVMTVGEGDRGGSIRTEKTFGDFQLHLE